MYPILHLKNIVYKISLFIKLFIFQIIFSSLLLLVVSNLDIEFPTFLPSYDTWLKDHFMLTFFIIAIFTPLFEESVFRLGLSLNKKALIWAFIASIIFTSLFISAGSFIGIGIMICHLVTILVMSILKKGIKREILIKWFSVLSILYFGLMHLNNYEPESLGNSYLLTPLIIGAQLILGYCCSIIRLKINFRAAILFHALYNALIILNITYY